MKPKGSSEMRRPRRRAMLSLLGLAGTGWALRAAGADAQPPPQCVVRPPQTEGPYYVDTDLARSDIRSEPSTGVLQPGIALRLTFEVSRLRAGRCEALANAQVELWQCNAGGVYSGVRDPHFDTTGQRFLRGHQRTDAGGRARFLTIYPGWYPGRTVHIHFMIRSPAAGGRRQEFASQLYFDDAFTDKVFTQPPYAARGPRAVRNAYDGIFRRGGSQLLLAVHSQNGGLAATFPIALADP
jgi:protocatechuate 3,4-dioxygenase beta subunit